MIQVQVPKDIRKFQTKAIGPFTLRQVVCLILGIVPAVLVAILVPLGIEYKILIGMIFAIPIWLCGFLKIDGATPEVYVIRLIYKYFLTSPKRKVKYENTYREAFKSLKKKEEKEKLLQMTVKERKRYIKESRQKKKIKYSNNPKYKIYT